MVFRYAVSSPPCPLSFLFVIFLHYSLRSAPTYRPTDRPTNANARTSDRPPRVLRSSRIEGAPNTTRTFFVWVRLCRGSREVVSFPCTIAAGRESPFQSSSESQSQSLGSPRLVPHTLKKRTRTRTWHPSVSASASASPTPSSRHAKWEWWI